MVDNEQLAQWTQWAESAVAGDAWRRQLAAEAAVTAGALGANQQDAVRAAQSTLSLTVAPAAVTQSLPPDQTLARLLSLGWQPPGLAQAPFVLNVGERLLGSTVCDAWVYRAVARRKGHTWVGGTSPVGLALLAASAAGNAATTAKRSADAAARWRQIGRSTLCVTNQRVLRYSNEQWNAYRLADIQSVELPTDRSGVVVILRGQAHVFVNRKVDHRGTRKVDHPQLVFLRGRVSFPALSRNR